MIRTKFWTRKVNKFLLVVATIFITFEINAQDTIYLKSEDPAIIANVLEVNPTNLKYKNFSNMEVQSIQLKTPE
ncbi:hypothetical protein [Chryseobacterium sp. MFBS3-17]|uniref:hypothetical protein n=1 Tax=Chryseobacterium sp. MFBS3-17 TaxID=2886689 RepID=UPI001D0E7A08|nr:hypothetical protein [Chryseobacterium sp. MFBS3-17]MCC2590010.1 hypothetical protein [Chryseobacterium sp. MFBS3-17]